MDVILKFVSQDSKYPIEHTVKRTLTTRDAVNKYVLTKFQEDEGSQRMQRAEIVLKKFGLLDHDFHLRPFLVKLLTEQIAGYYDDKTKTVNLLDWIPADQQKPVLAHELTHALQDQHVDLEKWEQQGILATAKNTTEDNQHIAVDEADDARDAVLEGQAMAVFVDYSLQPMGKSITSDPDLVNKFKETMEDSSTSPVMSRAPLLLQESLLFPYREGLSFEQAILTKRNPERAFAGTLDRPPASSFEILNPDAYLAHEPVPVLHLPDIHPLIDKDYTPYDVGVMGQLDVRILTQLFGGDEVSSELTPAWAGGIYYAAQRKSARTEQEKSSTASLGIIYYSQWKNADSARTFARVYADQLPRKYSSLKRRSSEEAPLPPPGSADVTKLADEEQIYSTPEGDVLLVLSGRSVFVSEGFDLDVARKLQALTVAAQGHGSLNIAQEKGSEAHQKGSGHSALPSDSELSASLIRVMSGAGMMKVGLQFDQAQRK